MSVLAVVSAIEDTESVITWAGRIAAARNCELHLLIWDYAPVPIYPLLADSENSEKVETIIELIEAIVQSDKRPFPVSEKKIKSHVALTPDLNSAVIDHAIEEQTQLIIAKASPNSNGGGKMTRSDALSGHA